MIVAAIRAAFEASYRGRFAYLMPDFDLVIESVSVECIGVGDRCAARGPSVAAQRTAGPPRLPLRCIASPTSDPPDGARPVMTSNARARGLDRRSGHHRARNSTTVVEPDWRASVTRGNHGLPRVARPTAAARRHSGRSREARAVQQCIHEYRGADGLGLQNTAYSVNIKERLDFSCALFDARGS